MKSFEEYYQEVFFRKWSPAERLHKKKASKRNRRGTNFKTLKPKKGFKRIKMAGTNQFIRVRLSTTEKRTKKVVAAKLGKKTF